MIELDIVDDWVDGCRGIEIKVGVKDYTIFAKPLIHWDQKGFAYVEHPHISPISDNPDCQCHLRTYIGSSITHYIRCTNCKITHHSHCVEAPHPLVRSNSERERLLKASIEHLCQSCLEKNKTRSE